MSTVVDADRVADLARTVVTEHDPRQVPIPEFLGACYDAGLSWVHFPEGLGAWVGNGSGGSVVAGVGRGFWFGESRFGGVLGVLVALGVGRDVMPGAPVSWWKGLPVR